jgi:hypothetical protein
MPAAMALLDAQGREPCDGHGRCLLEARTGIENPSFLLDQGDNLDFERLLVLIEGASAKETPMTGESASGRTLSPRTLLL